MIVSADAKIAHVVAALRTGYLDEIAREELAGLLEEARATVRQAAAKTLNQDARTALIGERN